MDRHKFLTGRERSKEKYTFVSTNNNDLKSLGGEREVAPHLIGTPQYREKDSIVLPLDLLGLEF